MEVIRIVGGPVLANCYIVKFNEEAIIIDPCVNLLTIKKKIGDFKLVFIIITHGHYDHFCYLDEIVNYYNVPIYLAKKAKEKLEDEYKNCSLLLGYPYRESIKDEQYHYVNDYEKTEIEGSHITFIHTPGHTDCSICIRIDNYFFSGDTIFSDGIGRCDLYSGNEAIMRNTLKELKKYFANKCPKDMIIYPGHEEDANVNYILNNNHYFSAY